MQQQLAGSQADPAHWRQQFRSTQDDSDERFHAEAARIAYGLAATGHRPSSPLWPRLDPHAEAVQPDPVPARHHEPTRELTPTPGYAARHPCRKHRRRPATNRRDAGPKPSMRTLLAWLAQLDAAGKQATRTLAAGTLDRRPRTPQRSAAHAIVEESGGIDWFEPRAERNETDAEILELAHEYQSLRIHWWRRTWSRTRKASVPERRGTPPRRQWLCHKNSPSGHRRSADGPHPDRGSEAGPLSPEPPCSTAGRAPATRRQEVSPQAITTARTPEQLDAALAEHPHAAARMTARERAETQTAADLRQLLDTAGPISPRLAAPEAHALLSEDDIAQLQTRSGDPASHTPDRRPRPTQEDPGEPRPAPDPERQSTPAQPGVTSPTTALHARPAPPAPAMETIPDRTDGQPPLPADTPPTAMPTAPATAPAAPPPSRESIGHPPTRESIAETPTRTPAAPPAIRESITQPTTREPAAPSTTRAPAPPPTTRTPAAPPTMREPASPPTTRTPAAPPTMREPASPPTTRAPAPPPAMREPAAPPPTRAPIAPPPSREPVAPATTGPAPVDWTAIAALALLAGTSPDPIQHTIALADIARTIPDGTQPPPEHRTLHDSLSAAFETDRQHRIGLRAGIVYARANQRADSGVDQAANLLAEPEFFARMKPGQQRALARIAEAGYVIGPAGRPTQRKR